MTLRERIAKELRDYFSEYEPSEVGINYTVVADRILALLGESEPVAWAVHFRRAVWTLDRVFFSPAQADERAADLASDGYETRTTPLFTSPTPTPHTYSGGHCIRCDAPEECRPVEARTVSRSTSAPEGGEG